MGAAVAAVRYLALYPRELASRTQRPRVSEPMVMDDRASVDAFHEVHPVMQLPVYRFNALAMSALLPEGGSVLDLGSGSGRLLAHLADARPDIRAVGTDLADTMLAHGRAWLQDADLAERVDLRHADITDLPADLCADVDLVSSVWALHHLPAQEDLHRCLTGIARIRERSGAAVWIFDFARLRREQTFPTGLAAIPSAPPRLCEDAVASERAAWSLDELRQAFADAGLGDLQGGPGRSMVRYVQAHFAPARDGRPSGHANRWCSSKLPLRPRMAFRYYRKALPSPA